MMLGCFELARDYRNTEVIYLSRSKESVPPTSFKTIFVGEQPNRTHWIESIKDAGLDVVIPVRDHAVYDIDLPFVGWIPDFQHLRLPELFDSEVIGFRDQFFLAVAQKAALVLLSSESARMDFEEFFPDHAAKARVAHFPSLLWALDRGNDSGILRKYHLPEKFALVANQFWQHKNHRILPPALEMLKHRGIEINLVVTGLPLDYRDPENKSLSLFFQESAKKGVAGSIHFLGQIPYTDLVAIMRAAALIIQPSFFEGWSTSIEDSKVLGRPLVCSDIPVHREQVPDALGFFDPKKPEMLANLLAETYEELRPGPDLQREEAAFALARKRASDYGCSLIEMAREAMLTTRLKELESLLKETSASAEQQGNYIKQQDNYIKQQGNYIKELEASMSYLRAELIRFRRSNHDLRRQSTVEFVTRNIRPRWRLVRKRLSRLNEKLRRGRSFFGRLFANAKHSQRKN